MAGQVGIQISAIGKQDAYLTRAPVFTFFKTGWRQYTRFAIESIEQTFNGVANFGNKSSVTVTRSGDLAWKMYLQVNLPALAGTNVAWTREIGHALIDYVAISSGGSPIDKHTGEWLSIWKELTLDKNHEDNYDTLIGNTTDMYTPSSAISAKTIYVPLQFWFNRNIGQSLPMIATAYSEIKLEFSFRSLSDITVGTLNSTPSMSYASLWVDYIFLTNEERRTFAQNPQDYLIDIVQHTGAETVAQTNYKSRLTFNHPTKMLAWVVRSDANSSANRVMDFTDGSTPYDGDHTISQAGLQLNSNDRFTPRDATTFNNIQPLQHCARSPRLGIYIYSFAIDPTKSSPSGTLNMSLVDNTQLLLTMTSGSSSVSLLVFALSYNLFRVRSGQAGSLYTS